MPGSIAPLNTSPLTAVELVNQAWDYYRTLGQEWLFEAKNAISDLSSVQVEPISFTVNYHIESFLPSFVAPTVPTPAALPTVTPREVLEPHLEDVALRELGEAPAEPDLSGFTPLLPAPPTETLPNPPPASAVNPPLEDIDVAVRPEGLDDLPLVPTLEELNIITVEAITIPAFEGVRPIIDIEGPDDGQLAWSELEYSSELATELTAKIRSMLQGSLGLPPAVERAIFDRGRAREEKLSRKLIQEVSEEMDTRNMTEPNGITAARIQQAREANRQAVGDLNQNLTIEMAKQAIENVRFACGQGAAWEQTLIAQNGQINERSLRAALAARDYAIARVNALIGIANLQQQAYATDAQVWRQLLEGELAKLQKTRLELEAEQLRGQLNMQRLAAYNASLEGLRTLADVYRADVDAAKAKGEINNQRLEAAKLRVELYSEQVKAYGEVQNAYKVKVEGALGRGEYAKTLSDIFATRMAGYKTKGEAYFNEGRFQLERNGQTLERFRAALAGADQDLRGQLAQLDAALRGNDQGVRLYEAKGTIASLASAATDRAVNLKIEQEKSRVQVELEKARIAIDQALKIGEILVEQIKAKAAAISQLAAASQSGVNFGASMSGSLGVSYGYSQSFRYSGDTDERNPYF
jgi:hypothetical protein